MTNKQRGDEAIAKIAGHCGEPGQPHMDVAYFIADLMHWCALNRETPDSHDTFPDLVAWGQEHYDEETRTDGEVAE